jgi:hypothetical protein
MNIKIAQCEIYIRTTPDVIMRFYRDVSSWPIWDGELDCVSLDGSFQNGTIGKLKPKRGPAFKFMLIDVDERGFSNVSKLPGARLVFNHTIEEKNNGVIVRHEAHISGPLSLFFFLILKRHITGGLKTAMNNLKHQAEKNEQETI